MDSIDKYLSNLVLRDVNPEKIKYIIPAIGSITNKRSDKGVFPVNGNISNGPIGKASLSPGTITVRKKVQQKILIFDKASK